MCFFVCGNNEYLWNNDFDDYQNDFLQAKSESHVLPLLEFRQLVVKLRAKSAFKDTNESVSVLMSNQSCLAS